MASRAFVQSVTIAECPPSTKAMRAVGPLTTPQAYITARLSEIFRLRHKWRLVACCCNGWAALSNGFCERASPVVNSC